MATYEVPLTPGPQSFTIALAGVIYRITLVWRDAPEGGWTLDLTTANGVALLSGVPLVTGADLLEQYRHLGIGGSLVVNDAGGRDAPPTFDGLGVAGRLYFVQ